MSNENDENVISPAQVTIRDKLTLLKKSKSKNNLDELDAEHQISSLSEVNNGDHLIITVNQTSYCHVLLENVNTEKNIIEVIYFDDTQTQCSLDEYMIDACKLESGTDNLTCRKVGVKKSTIQVDLKKVDLYKVDYALNECLSPEETIEKARKFI